MRRKQRGPTDSSLLAWANVVMGAFVAVSTIVACQWQLQAQRTSERPILIPEVADHRVTSGKLQGKKDKNALRYVKVVVTNAGQQPAVIEELAIGLFMDSRLKGMASLEDLLVDSPKLATPNLGAANLGRCEESNHVRLLQSGSSLSIYCDITKLGFSEALQILSSRDHLIVVCVVNYRSAAGSGAWRRRTTMGYAPPQLDEEKDIGTFPAAERRDDEVAR